VVALSLQVAHSLRQPARKLGFCFLGTPDAATAFGVTNGSFLQRFGITNGTCLEILAVTNGSSLEVDYTACAPQMKSNGVWPKEVQVPTVWLITTLPAGHGTLLRGRAGTLVITAPPNGEAWRLPVVWNYRLTKSQLLKNRGENLLAGLLHPGAMPRAIYPDLHTNYSVEISASPSRPTRRWTE